MADQGNANLGNQPPQAPAAGNNNNAIADALNNLAQALATMQAGQNAPAAAAVPPVLDPFASDQPFDLSSRAGSTAFQLACAPLDEKWDGDVSTFPPFLVSLKTRSQEMHWDDPVTGITFINNKNLWDSYQSITDQEIEDARIARTNPRAIQNARALYKTLQLSVTGDIKTQLFLQIENLPNTDDGVGLFAQMTKFTMTSAIQLSMSAFRDILNFDPKDHNFHIPTINTKLNHLFVLATTSSRTLSREERLQHIVTTYSRIRQPESWAQWIRNQIDSIEDQRVTDPQDFMNQAALKFYKIRNTYGSFQGSSNTITDDIVAMLADTKDKRKRKTKSDSPNSSTDDNNDKKPSGLPPFARHFKHSNEPDSPKYKVGDSKIWQGTTYYFCDCPNHLNKLKWHTHTADSCRTRQRWLEKQSQDDKSSIEKPSPHAHVADAPTVASTDAESVIDRSDTTSALTEGTDVNVLLATALGHLGDNPLAQNLIADALNCINE